MTGVPDGSLGLGQSAVVEWNKTYTIGGRWFNRRRATLRRRSACPADRRPNACTSPAVAGLELLVAANIIRTFAVTLESAVRTFLSFRLEVELTGWWR
jgi:hypothetical protein